MDQALKGEVKVGMSLPRTVWRRAKLQAVHEGRPLRPLSLDALSAYLARKEGTR